MAYASISITAPGSAKKEAKVNASVTVKNTTEFHYSFKGDILAIPDHYPHYIIGSIDQVIKSGLSVTRNVSFTMPDCDVTVYIYLERWSIDHWTYVGVAGKVVSLEIPGVPPPPPPTPLPPPPEPEPPPPPPPPPTPVIHIAFVDAIFSFVGSLADWFLNVAQSIPGYIDVFGWFSAPFYAISTVIRFLLTPIAQFGVWVDDVATKVMNVLTAEGILGLIKQWFPALGNVIEWFTGRWNWFISAVGDWWNSTKTTVLGWITIATEGFKALIVLWDEFWKITWPQWTATLEVLGSEVSNFFTRTLPNLLNYLKLESWWTGKLPGINNLIETAFKVWFPWYGDLVKVKDDLFKFFTDPLEFLWALFTDWFLGKED